MNIETLDLLREALPYIQRFKGKTFVVKFSGKVTEDKENLAVACRGAGPAASGRHPRLRDPRRRKTTDRTCQEARRCSDRIEGRRVTDDDTLELAKMIFRGKINTEILVRTSAIAGSRRSGFRASTAVWSRR